MESHTGFSQSCRESWCCTVALALSQQVHGPVVARASTVDNISPPDMSPAVRYSCTSLAWIAVQQLHWLCSCAYHDMCLCHIADVCHVPHVLAIANDILHLALSGLTDGSRHHHLNVAQHTNWQRISAYCNLHSCTSFSTLCRLQWSYSTELQWFMCITAARCNAVVDGKCVDRLLSCTCQCCVNTTVLPKFQTLHTCW